jgi:hypothetical protein
MSLKSCGLQKKLRLWIYEYTVAGRQLRKHMVEEGNKRVRRQKMSPNSRFNLHELRTKPVLPLPYPTTRQLNKGAQ